MNMTKIDKAIELAKNRYDEFVRNNPLDYSAEFFASDVEDLEEIKSSVLSMKQRITDLEQQLKVANDYIAMSDELTKAIKIKGVKEFASGLTGEVYTASDIKDEAQEYANNLEGK